ncbi:MAG: glycosyltransferase family 4 protein [Bryobacteraceae bacterium]
MLKVAAYTAGATVPSARFRVRQYIPLLRGEGVEVHEHLSVLGSYPPCGTIRRLLWAPLVIAERTASALSSLSTDVTLFQREMVSTLLTAEPLTRGPRVLDVDDAIFLHRRGVTARRLAALCDLVICGNGYLAEAFSHWNRNVRILPTAIDTGRFVPGTRSQRAGGRRIGWSGMSSGFRYLEEIAPALVRVMDRHRDVRLTLVADRLPVLPGIDPGRIEFIRWSENLEVAAVQSFTVGLMPLADDAWSQGKCSFKLLTYMACGTPAVASPVGMNAEVLATGGGLAACTQREWEDSILHLLEDEGAAGRMGVGGRQKVEQHYSLRNLAPRLAGLLKGVV